MVEIKITWADFLVIANKAIKEKYPDIDMDSYRFYKDYPYEGEGGHYDFPSGIYFEIDK